MKIQYIYIYSILQCYWILRSPISWSPLNDEWGVFCHRSKHITVIQSEAKDPEKIKIHWFKKIFWVENSTPAESWRWTAACLLPFVSYHRLFFEVSATSNSAQEQKPLTIVLFLLCFTSFLGFYYFFRTL